MKALSAILLCLTFFNENLVAQGLYFNANFALYSRNKTGHKIPLITNDIQKILVYPSKTVNNYLSAELSLWTNDNQLHSLSFTMKPSKTEKILEAGKTEIGKLKTQETQAFYEFNRMFLSKNKRETWFSAGGFLSVFQNKFDVQDVVRSIDIASERHNKGASIGASGRVIFPIKSKINFQATLRLGLFSYQKVFVALRNPNFTQAQQENTVHDLDFGGRTEILMGIGYKIFTPKNKQTEKK